MVAKALPFLHSVELERAILIGSDEGVLTNIIVISAYTLVLIVLSVAVFRKKMAKL